MQTIDINKADAADYNNWAIKLTGNRRWAAALACSQRAMQMDPTNGVYIFNHGTHLMDQARYPEASEYFSKAQSTKACANSAVLSRAICLLHSEQYNAADLAAAMIQAILEDEPGNMEFLWNLALCYLKAGRYKEGFDLYEHRMQIYKRMYPKLGIGEPLEPGTDVKDKHVIVQVDQGIGDVLMLSRYIGALAKLGARVHFGCQNEIASLFRNDPRIYRFYRQGEEYDRKCRYSLYLGSLPRFIGTTPSSIPAPNPHFKVIAGKISRPLPVAREGTLKVGLCWAGGAQNPRARERDSLIEAFAPIIADARFTCYSFQKGRDADLSLSGFTYLVHDLGPELHDWSDTIGYMKGMDAIVTVDTAVLHMAGSLDIPTLALLMYGSDWRWFDRAFVRSLWYPSVQLFRQDEPGKWALPIFTAHNRLGWMVDTRAQQNGH